jgi:ubiquinone/menaquinone biosynthesis C-methylase UbiE
MRVFVVLLGVLMFFAMCNQDQSGQEVTNDSEDTLSANDFMNQSELDDLISRFENPKRDAWQKPDEVIEMMNIKSGDIIADIGAGSGYFSFPLTEKAAKVIAIDIDKRMLEFIDERKIRDSIYNLETRRTKDYDPLLLNNEVDKVLLVNTFHHIEDRVNYLKRVKRGMKSGGSIYIIDFKKKSLPHGPPPAMKLKGGEIYSELVEAGFTNVEMDSTMLEYQNICVGFTN